VAREGKLLVLPTWSEKGDRAGVPKERGDIVLAYRRHIERQHDDD